MILAWVSAFNLVLITVLYVLDVLLLVFILMTDW